MNHIVSKLIIYGDLAEDSILMQLADICKNAKEHTQSQEFINKSKESLKYLQIMDLIKIFGIII